MSRKKLLCFIILVSCISIYCQDSLKYSIKNYSTFEDFYTEEGEHKIIIVNQKYDFTDLSKDFKFWSNVLISQQFKIETHPYGGHGRTSNLIAKAFNSKSKKYDTLLWELNIRADDANINDYNDFFVTVCNGESGIETTKTLFDLETGTKICSFNGDLVRYRYKLKDYYIAYLSLNSWEKLPQLNNEEEVIGQLLLIHNKEVVQKILLISQEDDDTFVWFPKIEILDYPLANDYYDLLKTCNYLHLEYYKSKDFFVPITDLIDTTNVIFKNNEKFMILKEYE